MSGCSRLKTQGLPPRTPLGFSPLSGSGGKMLSISFFTRLRLPGRGDKLPFIMDKRTYRLKGYDYSKARAYMVTLKKTPQALPFSVLNPGTKLGLEYTAITHPFVTTITQTFVSYYRGSVAVRRFVIMPDHIHLLLHLNPVPQEEKPNLIAVVKRLLVFLTQAYYAKAGESAPAPFEPYWHDSIAFKPEAVPRMERYIDQNPHRASRRYASDFCKLRNYRAKDGKVWWYYGQLDLVKRPTILAVDCSRKIKPESDLWHHWHHAAARIRSGCAGIGTFMSPCEKMVQQTILSSGGSLIILLPQGITPRWHPGEEMESLCAIGRVLYLTPFEAARTQPSAAELYQRCHAGGGLKELAALLACNAKSPPRE